MLAAVYPRVSTGLQLEGTSLGEQEELCKKKAYELGFTDSQIKIYREEGMTGEDIDRPAMNQLRQDISLGLITHVICVHPDRFSRDLTDKLIVCREFEKQGVELVFVDTEYKNTPEGQLFFNMQSAIAQYELSLIKKRTTRGRLKAVDKYNKIMPMRVAPYGYDFTDGALIINEKEAEFVKMIYQWYIYENLTMRQIGEKLFQLGASPKRGESKNWSASSIRRILSSEIYIGKYYYNKRKTQKVRGEKTASGNPKRTYEVRDPSEWICVEIPAIVDEKLYDLAQKQKNKNYKGHSGNIKQEYLLKSLIRCSCCGRIWNSTFYQDNKNKKKYLVYKCRGRFPRNYGEGVEACSIPTYSIRSGVLDEYVWQDIVSIIFDPELFIRNSQDSNKESSSAIQKMIDVLTKQIEQKNKEKEKVKIMFKREVIGEEEMFRDIKNINKETKEIQDEVNKLNNQLNKHSKQDNSLKQFYQLINSIKEQISKDELAFEEKRHIVELLVDEIIIEANEDNILLTYIGELDDWKKEKGIKKFNIVSCSQHQEI